MSNTMFEKSLGLNEAHGLLGKTDIEIGDNTVQLEPENSSPGHTRNAEQNPPPASGSCDFMSSSKLSISMLKKYWRLSCLGLAGP